MLNHINYANSLPQFITRVNEIIDLVNAIGTGGGNGSFTAIIANTTANGYVSTDVQAFAGVKTFTANVIIDTGATLSGNGVGLTGVLLANNATFAFGKTEGNLNVNGALVALATLLANNATFAFGKSEAGLNVNAAASALVANNSTFAFGKSEAGLNVNSAVTALTANNATNAFGKTEINLNVNNAVTATTALTANNATNAFGKTEINLNVNNAVTATTANNSTFAFGKTEVTLAINASAIGTGTVPTARLGTGTANSTTALYGDGTYKVIVTGAADPIAMALALG